MTDTRRAFFGKFAAVFFPLVIPASALGAVLKSRYVHELILPEKLVFKIGVGQDFSCFTAAEHEALRRMAGRLVTCEFHFISPRYNITAPEMSIHIPRGTSRADLYSTVVMGRPPCNSTP